MTSKRTRPIWFAGLLLVGVASGCADDPKYPYEQTVQQLYTLPSVVYIAPGDDVTLTARLLGYDDKIIVLPEWVRDEQTGVDVTPSSHTVDWKFTELASGITYDYLTDSPGHHRIQVSVAATVSQGTFAALEASANGKSDEVKIVVRQPAVPQNAAANQIWGAGPTPVPPPDGLGLAAEEVSGSFNTWSLRGYSYSLGPADVVSVGAASGTELMRERGLSFHEPIGTQVGGGKIDFPVRFWVATHGITSVDAVGNLKRHIEEDLEVANDIFEKNRTGISFYNIDGTQIHEIPDLADFVARYCTLIHDEIEALDWPLKAQMVLKQLHVVYSQGKLHDMRGVECTKSDGTGLVVVFFSERAPTTLAHELGHALGMNYRTGLTSGHPGGSDAGFDVGNLMWSGLDLRQATDRGRILVGQSNWMNVDKSSFVNLVPGLRSTNLPLIDCEDEADECPGLSLRMESTQ